MQSTAVRNSMQSLSHRNNYSYWKYAVFLFGIMGTISILEKSHRRRLNIRNRNITTPIQYRSLQWSLENTTTTNDNNENGTSTDDDDVNADTILITLSIFNTIFFVLPTTARYALQKRKCLRNPTNVNYDGCICSFPQLQNAISNSNNNMNNMNETSTFIICPATTIAFEQPLNITSKRFLVTCGTSRFVNTQACRFIRKTEMNNENFINFLIGAPTNVTIKDITFDNGYSSSAKPSNGNGGAIHMTGGYMTFQNVIFDSNVATNHGGAIYINTNVHPIRDGTNAIIKIRSRTTFRNNDALNGGPDIYIVPVVTKSPLSFFNITKTNNNINNPPFIHVECLPSTLLNRPKFCNYNDDPRDGSIVIENVTTDTERSKYTNCFNKELIDTQC